MKHLFHGIGRYGKRLILLIALSAVCNPFAVLQSLVIQYIPPYQCDLGGTDYQANSTKIWSNFTSNINASDDQLKSSCTYQNISGNTVSCTKFIFEGPEVSAVSEFGLVCSKAWMRPTLVSVYFIGKMVGGFFGGVLSDRFGRKKVFLIFTAIQFIAAMSMSFSNSVITYAVMLFISGSGSLVNFMAAVLLGVEMVPPRCRSLIVFLMNIGYSCGYMLTALVAFLFRDWRWYLRFTGLIGVVYLPYYWLLDESPSWLKSNGKHDDAAKILLKILKMNKTATKDEEEVFQAKRGDETKGCLKTFGELIKKPILIGRYLIIIWAWIVVTVGYYTIALNTNSLSGDRFLNMMFAGLMELLACCMFYVAVEAWGRRNTYSGVMGVTAALVAANPLWISWSTTVVTIATMLSKLGLSLAFGVVYTYTGELFPTGTRHTVLATASSFGRAGTVVAPFIIFVGESGNTATASYITAGLIALSSATVMLLPETKTRKLPQNVDEAVEMKRFTCC
uniref:organic cation transporter protein-like n=1 Tax=Ciona intestinalis TaxID=7719 RepID=UPI000EF51629|nr:organic cation transporter protein-like [Ciona intestinalis]|eukprot:XP_026695760.1 organic cation transporter protein-like [Ciona intestinalis]